MSESTKRERNKRKRRAQERDEVMKFEIKVKRNKERSAGMTHAIEQTHNRND